MLKIKHIPTRKCIGCGKISEKKFLLMIVKSPKHQSEKTFKILKGTDKKQGRSAYICNNYDCFLKAKKGRRLEKSFSSKIEPKIYNSLERLILKNE
ncbi:MAG: YlxR family protein [Acutalibacteraceae bacterium]